ncbi:twin-arginine translocase TatA/TatE family subunit [Arabiibacter massiliensis]|uniref:twin-arginine translocase TatA/TatE family subunit n=1 Tax=Arabiibacter massiliensis TaxID=1870985 RepID=UPI0009BA9201|nr:twin-arginine translocase TatA/TatE family subunit [Arabiibacter massiliensis]
MKILGMGMPELLIILAVILLIFGPKNLPKLGSALGKTVKNLRDGMGGGEKAIEDADEEEEEIVEEVEEPVKKTTTTAKKTTTAAKKKAE